MQKRIKSIWQLAYICLFIFVSSCSSSTVETYVDEERDDANLPKIEESSLANIMSHPQVFVNRDVTVTGLIKATDMRKVTKSLSLMTVKLTDKDVIDVTSSNYRFIEKLREAEDIISASRYKSVRLSALSAKKFHDQAYELKIAASRLQALGHYFNGLGKAEIATSFNKMADGFVQLGDAFLTLQDAAKSSSPQVESAIQDVKLEQTQTFEDSLLIAGGLMLVFANELEKARDVINIGYYAFDPSKALNPQRAHEILTYGSLLKAQSWKLMKDGNEEFHQITSVLSKGITQFGEGDKIINQALLELSKTLSKTAVTTNSDSQDSLKCAYYGFNGSHLRRCIDSINRLDKDVSIKITGTLRRSNLREEVDVLWLHATELEIDGIHIALSYGDENETMKSAMELYEWAEQVEKGK
ncbi:MAG: hypothetical protein NE334_01920 [Lentisphaeraceae bacterium]|nr:hypothetical protein [Lentisphaeraceae bacterium]